MNANQIAETLLACRPAESKFCLYTEATYQQWAETVFKFAESMANFENFDKNKFLENSGIHLDEWPTPQTEDQPKDYMPL